MDLVRREFVQNFTVIRTKFQTKGRGQIGNCWVSDKDKNLLFSVVLHPTDIPANNQFILSQCVALALRDTVALYCEPVTVKWPNDVYVGSNKIAGILIENLLVAKNIETSVIGIGLNVNQTAFVGAPNPTSLCLELHRECDSDVVLEQFLTMFRNYYCSLADSKEQIRKSYLENLYLVETQSIFKDKSGEFRGTITSVEEDGRLLIIDEYGDFRRYYFKEVEYLTPKHV